ncbi:hypothetical protein [Naumannella halotolerans]|uniref:hypothetical protein n=1 Tax=Naumannella halotolerans TaxID=993414 RepID=UPI0010616309|nr:hypothetical protein [Naumannella halotolerans]
MTQDQPNNHDQSAAAASDPTIVDATEATNPVDPSTEFHPDRAAGTTEYSDVAGAERVAGEVPSDAVPGEDEPALGDRPTTPTETSGGANATGSADATFGTGPTSSSFAEDSAAGDDATESGAKDDSTADPKPASSQIADAGVKTFYALAGLTDAVAEQVRKQAEAATEAIQTRASDRDARRKEEAEKLRKALDDAPDQLKALPETLRAQFEKFMDAFDQFAGRGRNRVDSLREQFAASVRDGAKEAKEEAAESAAKAEDDAEVARVQAVAEAHAQATQTEDEAELARQEALARADADRLAAEETAEGAEKLADKIDPKVDTDNDR